MKIAITTADFPPIQGGLSRLTTDLANQLQAESSLAGVLAPQLPDAEQYDQTLSYPVYRYSGYQWGVLRVLPGYWGSRDWRKTIQAQSDHVLVINPSFGGSYALLDQIAGTSKPFSVFAYGYEFLKFDIPKPRWGKSLLLKIYNRAEHVLAISRFTRDQLHRFGVPLSKIQVCYLGVDTQLFTPEMNSGKARQLLGCAPEGPILLTVGRLVSRKKHDMVIRAVAELCQFFPKLDYWIVGSGPQEKELKRLTKELKLERHVRFWGNVPDDQLTLFYQASDVFVLPAVQEGPSVEGLGLVFQEAAACGKPTVGARSGGVPEALVHGQTGVLVEPGDQTDLCNQLKSLLDDEKQRAHMGECGRDWILKQKDWRICRKQILSVLQSTT